MAKRKPQRPFIECDDVQGSYRDAIVQEHLEWVENGGVDQHLKDFSAAPIAHWVQRHCRELSRRRNLSSRKWRAKTRN